MACALQLAERGRATSFPNPRVGALVVRDGVVVGRGWHERAGEPHAEVFALREAAALARGAELFVTLEPCSHHGRTPPCADAVIAAGIAKVYVAMQDPNPLVAGRGLERLREAGIAVEVGLLENAARALNRGYVSRMTRGRPFVTLKLGMSLDARTAMASGEAHWITSAQSRADVHRLRAQMGAVMTTSNTVLADDPRLTARLGSAAGGAVQPSRQPDRVILDSRARVPSSAQVWNEGARRLWLTVQPPPAVPPGVEHIRVAAVADGAVDLPAALQALGGAGINELLVECGPHLVGALLQAGLADELLTYIAPCLLGAQARALAVLPGLERLDQRLGLRFTEVRQIGPDLRITAVPQDS